MKAIIHCEEGSYANIEGDSFDVDNDFLYVYNGKSLVGVFSLKYMKDAHLSETKTKDG